MAGRRPGYRHTQATRDKIQAGTLVHRLHKVAMGEIEATAQQVNAAKTLLNKVLPDLSAIEIDAELEAEVVTKIQHEIVDPKTSS